MKMALGKTVMLFGLGDLGSWVLEYVAREPGISRIITCDPREDWGTLKTTSVQVIAGHIGLPVKCKYEKVDVFNLDQTAELIQKYEPDLIYAAMSLLSWWVPAMLPPEVHEDILKAAGPLLPTHATLVARMMTALRDTGLKPLVLNHSWPDLTNPILARNGLDVAVGAGNLDLIVAEIRRRVSEELHVPIPEVNVWFIGQHVLVMRDVDLGIPYFCKIMVDDTDVTEQFDVDALINGTFYRKVPADVRTSWLMQNVVATCALRIIRAMINDTGAVTHAPGPNGLIGGYPIRVDATGVEVVLPTGISLEHAEQINIEDSKFEGVQEIREDGSVIFTEEAVEVMKKYFGMPQKELRFEEMADRAEEIVSAYKKLAEKYNAPTYFF
jgi:hypothetical protein